MTKRNFTTEKYYGGSNCTKWLPPLELGKLRRMISIITAECRPGKAETHTLEEGAMLGWCWHLWGFLTGLVPQALETLECALGCWGEEASPEWYWQELEVQYRKQEANKKSRSLLPSSFAHSLLLVLPWGMTYQGAASRAERWLRKPRASNTKGNRKGSVWSGETIP